MAAIFTCADLLGMMAAKMATVSCREYVLEVGKGEEKRVLRMEEDLTRHPVLEGLIRSGGVVVVVEGHVRRVAVGVLLRGIFTDLVIRHKAGRRRRDFPRG